MMRSRLYAAAAFVVGLNVGLALTAFVPVVHSAEHVTRRVTISRLTSHVAAEGTIDLEAQTHEAIDETLERLKKAGFRIDE